MGCRRNYCMVAMHGKSGIQNIARSITMNICSPVLLLRFPAQGIRRDSLMCLYAGLCAEKVGSLLENHEFWTRICIASIYNHAVSVFTLLERRTRSEERAS